MIKFSVDNYGIEVFMGEQPTIWDYYKKHAVYIDDTGLKKEDTPVYIIISRDFIGPQYTIIAFSTNPVGYAGFTPALYYEKETQVLFIGAGGVIKTFELLSNKLIFEKDWSFGFWGWVKCKEFILQQEETTFGIFNTSGEQLWETHVEPPYDFEIDEGFIFLKFNDIVEKRVLATGEKIQIQ